MPVGLRNKPARTGILVWRRVVRRPPDRVRRAPTTHGSTVKIVRGIQRRRRSVVVHPGGAPVVDRIADSEITPREVYLNRRTFMRAGLLAATAAGTALLYRTAQPRQPGHDRDAGHRRARSPRRTPNGFWVDEPLTPRASILNYNNFYEFSTDKDGVAAAAAGFKTTGWQVDGRRPGAQAARVRPRRSPAAQPARGARLPDALRRGLVDGDSVGRLLAVEAARRGRADGRREVRRLRDAARSGADAEPEHRRRSSGRTSKGCASTRRCIR